MTVRTRTLAYMRRDNIFIAARYATSTGQRDAAPPSRLMHCVSGRSYGAHNVQISLPAGTTSDYRIAFTRRRVIDIVCALPSCAAPLLQVKPHYATMKSIASPVRHRLSTQDDRQPQVRGSSIWTGHGHQDDGYIHYITYSHSGRGVALVDLLA